MQVREKVEKSRSAVFFQGFVSAEGLKVGSLKRPGEMRDEKLQAIVARSSFGSSNAKTTSCSKHCGAKHVPKSKVLKTGGFGARFEVRMLFSVAGAMDSARCQKWANREDFVAISETMAGVGRVKRDLSRGRRHTRDISSRHVRRSGRWFSEKGWFWSSRIFRFAKMILRDRHNTSYDLA